MIVLRLRYYGHWTQLERSWNFGNFLYAINKCTLTDFSLTFPLKADFFLEGVTTLIVQMYFIYCIWKATICNLTDHMIMWLVLYMIHRGIVVALVQLLEFATARDLILESQFLGTLNASPFELIWLAFHYPGSKLYVNSLFAFRIDPADTLETMYYLVSIKEDKQDTVRIHTLCRFKSRQLRQPKRAKKTKAHEHRLLDTVEPIRLRTMIADAVYDSKDNNDGPPSQNLQTGGMEHSGARGRALSIFVKTYSSPFASSQTSAPLPTPAVLWVEDVTHHEDLLRNEAISPSLAFSYARLSVLSVGFQYSFGKAAATDEEPFLWWLLQPKCAQHLSRERRVEIRDLVQRVIDLLSSPEVAIDDRHGPKLYARFLQGLLATPMARAPGTLFARQSLSPPPATSSAASSPKPDTPPLASALLQLQQAQIVAGAPQYAAQPTTTSDLDIPGFFSPPLFYDSELLQSMQSITDWPDMVLSGFNWMGSMQQTNFNTNMRYDQPMVSFTHSASQVSIKAREAFVNIGDGLV
ncbi:predicted protein [Postia placenta Mad-698-R]|nr:predicted protein [Postia placenta Mad-698-R]